MLDLGNAQFSTEAQFPPTLCCFTSVSCLIQVFLRNRVVFKSLLHTQCLEQFILLGNLSPTADGMNESSVFPVETRFSLLP